MTKDQLYSEHRLIILAAKRGDVPAMYKLARFCAIFRDPPLQLLQGKKSSLFWAKQAAKRGCGFSAQLAGHIYCTEKEFLDLEKALFWYQRAQELGCEEVEGDIKSVLHLLRE